MTDDLATRFPLGRRVQQFCTPPRTGIVVRSAPSCLHVRFDDGSLGIYDDVWFRAHPTMLRLMPNLVVREQRAVA